MKLSNQVVSLELSKKLKKLGVKQDSLFVWRKHPLMKDDAVGAWQIVFVADGFTHSGKNDISAFTFSELFELYNSKIVIPKDIDNLANFVADLLIDKLSAKI